MIPALGRIIKFTLEQFKYNKNLNQCKIQKKITPLSYETHTTRLRNVHTKVFEVLWQSAMECVGYA